MYCTGGIRCEKASAYLKYKGFENVYQLEGGIIEYTRQAKQKGIANKFVGKNFVFDERLAERISDEVIAHCHQCGKPADTHINCANTRCHLLFIQCDECRTRYAGCCSDVCKDFHVLPAEEQKAQAHQHEFNGSKFGKAHYTVLKGALMCFLLMWTLSCQFFSPVEVVENKDERGQKERFERRKKDYARTGRYEKFYADGKKYIEATYVNDSLDGERRFFYPNGNIESVETYQRGVFHGPYRHYYETGTLQLEQVYVKGVLQGISKRYYPNGQVQDEVMLVNNEENGVFIEYYENGNKKAEGYYTPGDESGGPWEQGELKEYDEAGTLMRIANCRDGRCETTWRKDELK
jgi:antitoxin component YwqK of YwqJK toxin-antitoxin module